MDVQPVVSGEFSWRQKSVKVLVTIQRKKIEKTKKRLDKGFCQIFDFLFAPRGLSCKSKQET
jgi:hypothetical protein